MITEGVVTVRIVRPSDINPVWRIRFYRRVGYTINAFEIVEWSLPEAIEIARLMRHRLAERYL